MASAGTVILTGANSSMGLHSARHALQTYPAYTFVFTVRDASDSDANTNDLRAIIAQYPEANASVHALDLASLAATHAFADSIVGGVQAGQYPPITAIIANAYYWNLVGNPEPTGDGFEKTFQVSFISHAALVLRLLGSFGSSSGRIVLISSDSLWPGKNGMEKYPPSIPEDLSQLVKPTVIDDDKQGRGYQRYATSKLAMTAWMYALNKHLEKDTTLNKITAVAMNPGNMVDSRALRTNTPQNLQDMQRDVFIPRLSELQLTMGPTLRTSADAGPDVVELTLSPKYADKRGFYTLLQEDESSPDSKDEGIQSRLWTQVLEWARISRDNTALSL